MFIHKYVNDFYFTQIMSNYDIQYLNTLSEVNFIKIYNLFKQYDFYFIDDIILKYLEIFSLDYKKVLRGIILLKEALGDNFVDAIGKNIAHLNLLLELDDEN